MSRDFHPTINVLIYYNYIDNIQTSSKSVTIRFILSVIWKNTITRIPYFFTHTRVHAATSYFPVGSPTGNLSTHRFFPPIWGNTHILVSLEPSTNVPRRSFQAASVSSSRFSDARSSFRPAVGCWIVWNSQNNYRFPVPVSCRRHHFLRETRVTTRPFLPPQLSRS